MTAPTRKGAVRAGEGDMGIIPGSMSAFVHNDCFAAFSQFRTLAQCVTSHCWKVGPNTFQNPLRYI
jgi:hypothetical protein